MTLEVTLPDGSPLELDDGAALRGGDRARRRRPRRAHGRRRPRLAVIDWDLPDLDGPELCRILRDFNLGRPPYIILLAPAGRESGVPTDLQAGANDIVLLPASAKELRTRVEFGRRVVELPWCQPSVDGEADARQTRLAFRLQTT